MSEKFKFIRTYINYALERLFFVGLDPGLGSVTGCRDTATHVCSLSCLFEARVQQTDLGIEVKDCFIALNALGLKVALIDV